MGRIKKKYSKLKKKIVKQELMKGKSARQSLRKAGYSEGHIRRSTTNKIVKDSMEEIKQELKKSDITIDLLIQRLNHDRQLAIKKGDISTATRVDELLGKIIAAFTDKSLITNLNPDKISISYAKIDGDILLREKEIEKKNRLEDIPPIDDTYDQG